MTVVSNAFIALARKEAGFFGMPELPMVDVPHRPWYAVSAAEWRGDAEGALEGIIRLLSAPAAVGR